MSFNKIFKEKEYVEELLKQKYFNNTIKSDIKLIAKYLKSQGKNDEQIEQELNKILSKKIINYNEVLFYKIIENAIKFANKNHNNLIQIDSIPITKNELDFINSLPYNKLEKKILFTFIVLDKLNQEKRKLNNYEISDKHYFGNGGTWEYKLLLDTLQEKITRTYKEKGIHLTIKKFNDDKLTRTTKLLTVELLFINNIKHCNEIVIEITDFDSIGLFYDFIMGDKKVKWCEECSERLIKVNGKYKKYCIECYKTLERARKRKVWHKMKNKN